MRMMDEEQFASILKDLITALEGMNQKLNNIFNILTCTTECRTEMPPVAKNRKQLMDLEVGIA